MTLIGFPGAAIILFEAADGRRARRWGYSSTLQQDWPGVFSITLEFVPRRVLVGHLLLCGSIRAIRIFAGTIGESGKIWSDVRSYPIFGLGLQRYLPTTSKLLSMTTPRYAIDKHTFPQAVSAE